MKKKRGGNWTIVFLCCTLAVPTVAIMFGVYEGQLTLELLKPALVTGALLGVAHLVLRPVLRLLFIASQFMPPCRLTSAFTRIEGMRRMSSSFASSLKLMKRQEGRMSSRAAPRMYANFFMVVLR